VREKPTLTLAELDTRFRAFLLANYTIVMPDSEAARLYANSMSRIRQRIDLVQQVLNREIELGSEAFDAELVYLQLRKVLEEIAFSSLAANKAEYSTLHANFAKHWKAEKILQVLEGVNADFYPQPLAAPISAKGFHHFDLLYPSDQRTLTATDY
jgi:hypothetical protein